MGISLAELQRYRRLADRGAMPLRIYAMADGNGAALESLCANGLYRHAPGRLQMRAVKLFADGALGSRGALLEDYSDDHGNRGLLVMSAQELADAAAKARRCGTACRRRPMRSATAATAWTLDTAPRRWAPRLPATTAGRAPSTRRSCRRRPVALRGDAGDRLMQLTHATSDMPWAQDRVGAQRIVGAYAWRQLRDSGARLAFGSDFPVEIGGSAARPVFRGEPRRRRRQAGRRLDAAGETDRVRGPARLHPGCRVCRFRRERTCSLAPGKRADFVVLAEDPAVPDMALRTSTCARPTSTASQAKRPCRARGATRMARVAACAAPTWTIRDHPSAQRVAHRLGDDHVDELAQDQPRMSWGNSPSACSRSCRSARSGSS